MMDLVGRRHVRVLFGAVLLGCGLLSRPAVAEPSGDANVQTAVLYRTGVSASDEGRSDDARVFFLAAWRMKQHWQIAANLAAAEARTGRHRDAAEHFEFALRTGLNELSPQERQRIQELLNKSRAHIGALTIQVNVPQAEVLVDGVVVGKSPLTAPIFVEPGARTIEARRHGYTQTSVQRQLAAGAVGSVELKLEALQAPSGARSKGSSAGDVPRLSAGDQELPPDGSSAEKPSQAVLIAGILGTTAALGVGVTTIGLGSAADTEENRKKFGYVGIWSLAGAGAIGLATGMYALFGSGSQSKPQTATVRVGPYPGGVVVAGAF
jgi:hypothetical protein